MLLLCRIWNIFAQMFIFVSWDARSAKMNVKNVTGDVYAFNPHKMVKKCHTYVVISENI